MSGVSIRNKLDGDIFDVKLVFASSIKGTGALSYLLNSRFNWANLDNMCGSDLKTEISIGYVGKGKERSVNKQIEFVNSRCGYWQVWFTYLGKRYAINKNAQYNPRPIDSGTCPDISIQWEMESKIRLDCAFRSGHKQFYVTWQQTKGWCHRLCDLSLQVLSCITNLPFGLLRKFFRRKAVKQSLA